MKNRTILRRMGLIAIAALLTLSVLAGCSAPADGGDNNPDADPHAGHSHADSTPTEHDHAGHTHAQGVTDPLAVSIKQNGETYSLTISHEGEALFEKKDLPRSPFKEKISDDIYAFFWATDYGPNDFCAVYCDPNNCRVSELFTSPFASDGVRVVLPQGGKGGYSVLIRDIFDADKYSKTYELEDAYTGADGSIFSGKMIDKTHCTVSYYTNKDGAHRIRQFDLYAE
ncbi:MAG: hypothetical protein IJO42_02920 [Clostridia bacterium]|nr:hypothetical protein [Clostridia bacterium]